MAPKMIGRLEHVYLLNQHFGMISGTTIETTFYLDMHPSRGTATAK
jgi:hypothetical protein